MLNILIALGIFGTILVFLQGCAALHRVISPRGKDRAIERLQKWSTPESVAQLEIVRKESLSDIPWLHELLATVHRFQPLRILHRQADCQIPLGIFALGTPLLGLLGLMGSMWILHFPFVLALVPAALCGAAPAGYLYWLKTQRMKQFERQLPEALELIARALKAGHAFSVGLKLVGEEAADPVGIEFRRVFDEVSLGVPLPQALQSMTNRLDSVDLRFFVTSVLVQRETGGNLAEIIDSLSDLIRKRFELQLKVRALSAEGRFSGVILFCLPILVGMLLYQMNPEYMGLLLTDRIGQTMVMVGSFLMVTGAFAMKRLIAIKV
ncbi:MAG: type II secretion system F family protein [Nitrospira sp.]|jgi:tight adherence protein B|nr:type II secretion system F family protein [Nitrospira sp.]